LPAALSALRHDKTGQTFDFLLLAALPFTLVGQKAAQQSKFLRQRDAVSFEVAPGMVTAINFVSVGYRAAGFALGAIGPVSTAKDCPSAVQQLSHRKIRASHSARSQSVFPYFYR
jgi:hypothetical protein